MIVILAAMKEELDAISEYVENPMRKMTPFGELVEGTIANTSVVCAQSGVGKAAAAGATTFLMERYAVSAIINVGSAGGLSKALSIGDVVVGQQLTYHDLDLSAFNYPKGWANTDYVFNTDKKLLAFLEGASQALDLSIFVGNIVSGDQFIYDKKQFDAIIDVFDPVLAVEMEGAAIAHIASKYHVPCAILRSISDIVIDEDNASDFNVYIKKAAANSAAIVHYLIRQLAHQ